MGAIAMDRVMEKLDRLYAADDTAGAKRHLLYWMEEAKLAGDERAQLTIGNELMGLYRMAGEGDASVRYAETTAALVRKLGLENTATAATVCVNCGTVYTAVGRTEDALAQYRMAEDLYARLLDPVDERVGSLYNNMAACLTKLEQYRDAMESYSKALSIMRQIPGSEPEIAITLLNIADLLRDAYGLADACERIDDCTQHAHDLLETEGLVRDGRYAQACAKCAPVFEYYGWFVYAKELRKRAADIYSRAKG